MIPRGAPGSSRARPSRVLVVGGGVAGLEALIALRALAGAAVDLQLLSPGDDFVYRPLEVLEPFDPDAMVRVPWARIVDDQRVTHLADTLHEIELDDHRVTTATGQALRYDLLVLAPGASVRPSLAGAITVGAPGATALLRQLIGRLRAGAMQRVAFVVPPGTTWTLPIYELALLTAGFARRAGVNPELLLVTAEAQPLEAFGAEASKMVSGLLGERSIRLHTEGLVERRAGGRLWLELPRGVRVDRIVALPRLQGPRIAGLRADDDGFLLVDEHGRVRGEDDVYAAGDAIAFPVKQGGLAAQQADAAAAQIAARAGVEVEPRPFEPVLRAMLLTGEAPRFLRRALTAAASDSELSGESPWWPAAKIVGHHLGPYLAAHVEWTGRAAHGPSTQAF
jgi:sulfide:quinone oxidoreductase